MPTIEEPALLPEWASNAPAGSIVEPTQEEKEEGWWAARGNVFRVTIDAATPALLYRVIVNGANADHTTGGAPTLTTIRDALIAAVNALAGGVAGDYEATIETASSLRITAADGVALTVVDGGGNLTVLQIDSPRTGRPPRPYMNWLQWLYYLWLLFLSAVRIRWSDFGGDWDIDGGTLPSTGAGLVGTSGVATSYINGRRVAGLSEAHTFTASRRTYIDLNQDAEWLYTETLLADPAPAVPANSRRMFSVETNATDRTVSTDLRAADRMPRARGWRLGDQVSDHEPRIRIPHASGGAGYTLLEESAPTSGGVATMRRYIRHSDGRTMQVRGARWDADISQWRTEAGSNPEMWEEDSPGSAGYYSRSLHLASTGTPFDDSLWAAADDGGNTRKGRLFASPIAVNTTQNDRETARLPSFQTVIAAVIRNFVSQDGHIRRYVFIAGGTGAVAYGEERVNNASYNESTGLWTRTETVDVYKVEQYAAGGYRILRHASALAASWSDTITGATWELIAQFRGGAPSYLNALQLPDGLPGGFTRNTLYGIGVTKARAYFASDGAGGFTQLNGFGFSAVAYNAGARILTLTLSLPMVNAYYEVHPEFMGIGGANPFRKVTVLQHTNTQIQLQMIDLQNIGGGAMDLATGAAAGDHAIGIAVFGEQAA